MRKRIISTLLVFVTAYLLLPMTAFAAGSLSNFTKNKTYAAGHFSDVPAYEWYADEVQIAYEYGLVDGTALTTFSPYQNLTIAEAIKIASCVNEIYNTGVLTLTNGTQLWYQPYVDYALSNRIIRAYPDYTAYATRSDMAVIYANALPDEAFAAINQIDDNAIPDVSVNHTYSGAVYKLYRAGILTGVDDSHAYNPDSTITRAEVATIVARMIGSGSRVPFSLTSNGSTPGTPQTTSSTIAAAPASVTVAKGAQAAVICTTNGHEFNRITPVIGDPSIASCTWGIPNNNTFPLSIIGLSAGTTTITVSLLGVDSRILSETAINVTVTGDTATTTTIYFPGYYPVPDYGAYAGAMPNYIDYNANIGSIFYAYRISDIIIDMNDAITGYKNLLLQNGFIFDYLYSDMYGADILVYNNSDFHMKVFFTNSNMNGVPSIMLRVTPF